MYFNAESQSRIISQLHFGLVENGLLLLGKSEMLLRKADLFRPLELRLRIFQKISNLSPRERVMLAARAKAPPTPNGDTAGNGDTADQMLQFEQLKDSAWDSGTVAQIVVGIEGELTLVNAAARGMFGLGDPDLGRLFSELSLSYRPVELRASIDKVCADRQPLCIEGVSWSYRKGEQASLDISIRALLNESGELLGVLVIFADVTQLQTLRSDMARTGQELQTASEELQSTNEELQTNNEELQSTVEELETTNEELQSTNEELETMNEELQTINDELRLRTDELNRANASLEAVLGSMRAGIVVLDTQLRVLKWSEPSRQLWGVTPDEARLHNLPELDIGLPFAQLEGPMKACLSEGRGFQRLEVAATNRRGKPIRCQVTLTPLVGLGGKTEGLVMVIEELP